VKRLYWRPQKVSGYLLMAIGLLSVCGVWCVRGLPIRRFAALHEQRLQAAKLADASMRAIRDERLRLGHVFHESLDPGQTGMIGEQMSLVTSLPGGLSAKRTSVNPNFAAVVVDLLRQAGVREGDCVAVGCTGSFPALNVAVFAALESMRAHPLVIHSAASSQYGANHPEMMWSDMERLLHDKKMISFRSAAITYGGQGDRDVGLSPEAAKSFEAAISRSGVPPLRPRSLRDSIQQRMRLYRQLAAGRDIKAYINVGGGSASLRGSKGKAIFSPGLTMPVPPGVEDVDCVMSRFAKTGVPVIHLGDAVELAGVYGLPIAPPRIPVVGAGDVFVQTVPNRYLAGGVLFVVVLALRACVLTDAWHRLWDAVSKRSATGGQANAKSSPQWMV
jgi:poly-gamma-glutamate system protein